MNKNLLDNLPKALCKVCNQMKVKVYMGLYKGGTSFYVDSNGQRWHGKACGDCRRDFKRERYGKKGL